MDMKIRKELPLAVNENLCHLYLNYQNINSICFVEEHYKNFFFSNYLNCYSANLDWFKFQYIPDNSMLNTDRFIETRVVDSTILNSRLDKAEILKFILQSLNNNYYVDIYVDEFYLQGTLNYKTEHFPHEQLIYGYDLLAKKFKFLSINKNGQPAKLVVMFDLFIDSMIALLEDYFKQFQYDQIKYYPYFKLYRKKPDWIDFDIRNITNQLDTYINGDDIFPLYSTESASISYLNKEHRIYSGIKVYDNFCNYMENLNNTEMINVPFAYGLMEQIIIMKYRIQYIFKFGKNFFTASKKKEIIESFDKLIMLHTQLVNMCVKENIRFPRIGNRSKISITAEMIKNEVLVFYKNIYKIIKDIDYKIILNNNRIYYGVIGDKEKAISNEN